MTGDRRMPRSVYATRLNEFSRVAFADLAARHLRGTWSQLFSKRIGERFSGRIMLEIGCFNAGYLSSIAAAYPDTAFVGIDWKCKAIYDGAKQISTRGLENVVLIHGRAQDLPSIFAGAELDEIWIFHPDPCERPAERKNRLVSEAFLLNAHKALREQSTITLKTDHLEYYQSVMNLFPSVQGQTMDRQSLATHYEIAVTSTNFWLDKRAITHTANRCFAARPTLFEARFINRRSPIFLIELRKR